MQLSDGFPVDEEFEGSMMRREIVDREEEVG